jgi:hypothetical protein
MWALLPKKFQLTLIFVCGMLAVRLYDAVHAIWASDPVSFWQSASFAVTVVGTILVVLLEASWRWIWARVPWLQRAAFPDLNGTWEGELVSTWINPETGQSPPPISATFTVRQGIFKTSVTMRTGESQSHSDFMRLERLPSIKRHRIWYSYRNAPKAQVEHRSAPHEGIAYLEIDVASDADLMEGRYYTARKTTGDISIRRA